MTQAGLPDVRRDRAFETPVNVPADGFARDGYLGPVRVFTSGECRRIAAYLHHGRGPAPADWEKGRAVHERFIYEIAARRSIVSAVRSVLGPDVVLWGACAVSRTPGQRHAWHSDIESAAPDGRFVSVWVGIEHTSRESALQLITRSHLLGRSVQEARAERGWRREEATPEALLELAQGEDAEALLLQPDMTNGDALLFDGRLWHGSDNSRSRGRRLALLLQYAAADCPVRIPDFRQLDWPFRLHAEPRPATIVVSGADRYHVNRVVAPPPPETNGVPMIATAIHKFDLPLDDPPKPWQGFPAFRGPTRTLSEMGCHASVLVPGHSPHPPHAHREEELLIPLHGEAELVIAASPTDPSPRLERVRPGSFVYYPAWQHHTIRNPGTSPIAYLMFKWDAATYDEASPLATGIFNYPAADGAGSTAPFQTRLLFEGPTGCLGKLHAHYSVAQPGGGYAPHVDAHDVAIVMLSGTVETLGQQVGPRSVIYYAAGESHGMRNTGTEPARYLVFEFHAPGQSEPRVPPPMHRHVAGALMRLGKRVARPVWRRLHGAARRLVRQA
jgi:mannose-6-phosphate isomerase-like protein (cupin superfamily)